MYLSILQGKGAYGYACRISDLFFLFFLFFLKLVVKLVQPALVSTINVMEEVVSGTAAMFEKDDCLLIAAFI